VIIFDSSFLVVLMYPTAPPAKDRDEKPVAQFKERVAYLAAKMDVSNEVIGVPAPAMAEILVRAGEGRAQYVSVLSNTWKFQILPFDSRAAIEASELIAKVKSNKDSWGKWAKVKFDIQIASIAKAESATVIYADDKDIENLGKRLKIRVVRICDLPLPPAGDETPIELGEVGSQGLLNLAVGDSKTGQEEQSHGANADASPPTKPVAEADNQLKADPANSSPVQGSDK
jgi:hypothetical protein